MSAASVAPARRPFFLSPAHGIVLALSLMATNASAQAPVFGSCADETTAPAALVNDLDAYLTALVAENSAPGAVVSVTGPDWRYIRSAGHTTAGGDTPIDCDMPFQIGSNTKMMTATVILQLQERERCRSTTCCRPICQRQPPPFRTARS